MINEWWAKWMMNDPVLWAKWMSEQNEWWFTYSSLNAINDNHRAMSKLRAVK